MSPIWPWLLAGCATPPPPAAALPARLQPTPATPILGGALDSSFGWAVDGGCDVNADGYDDLIVGAPWWMAYAGGAFVFHGGPSGPSPTPATSVVGGGGWQGQSVACLGDVDGDGHDDVAIGAPYTPDGTVWVHHGSASGIDPTPAVALSGDPAAYSAFGVAVAGAGDVNADGFDDLLVGVYAGGNGVDGAVRLFLGGPGGVSTTPAAEVVGAQSGIGDEFGLAPGTWTATATTT